MHGTTQLAIDAIFAQRTVATGYEELYQAVDNLCLHKLGARLHGRLFDEVYFLVLALL
jgi:hypothetical protein